MSENTTTVKATEDLPMRTVEEGAGPVAEAEAEAEGVTGGTTRRRNSVGERDSKRQRKFYTNHLSTAYTTVYM